LIPIGPQAPPMTEHRRWRLTLVRRETRRSHARSFRKEVIQPQVPLRLPCYDFTPVTNHTMDGCLPYGLDDRLPVQLASMV
jgi:hypothetical protein